MQVYTYYDSRLLPSKKVQVSAHNDSSTSYQMKIDNYTVTINISNITKLLLHIEMLYDIESDDQYYGYGDVRDSYNYSDYKRKGELQIPTNSIIEKLNGKLHDEVLLENLQILSESIPKLETTEEPKENVESLVEPDVTVEQYADNIHFINLHHLGTRNLIVQFSDYIFVAEAPLNSKNGKLLIEEIRKIAPNKPIKYFAFGHFYPHYTGGMRPFIHEGAKIMCTKEDQDYVRYIADAPRTLNPDALQLEPNKLQFEEIENQKNLSDASQEMVIYHIGSKSKHTNDYLIYYFPKENMLFQDDLFRLRKNSTKENLSKTTKGLYNAIKDLDIEVDDIVQNWSIFDKSRSMKFKFADIEKIMIE